MSVDVDEAEVESNGTAPVESSTEDGWRQDKKGRWITPARGRSGVVYRQGNETIDEAHARDAKGPKDRKPQAKRSKVPKAPAPTQASLKELEFMLAETLQAPAMVAAMGGDVWAANHFTREGPVLARNLTQAAAHNPWLRAKLEAALTGEDLLIKLMTLLPVAAALVAYAIPPVIYYLNPGFLPPEARAMFNVPERPKKPEREEEHGPAQAPESADTPVGAAA